MNIYQKSLAQLIDQHGREIIKNSHYKDSQNRLYAIIEEIMSCLPEDKVQTYFSQLEIAISELDYVSDYFYFSKGFKDGIKIMSNNNSNPLNNDFPYYDDEPEADENKNKKLIQVLRTR